METFALLDILNDKGNIIMKNTTQCPSQTELRDIFDYKDADLYWKIKPCKNIAVGNKAGYIDSWGYISIGLYGMEYKAHRLIWVYHNGDIPNDYYIDHINGMRDDNRIINLRLVSSQYNISRSKTSNSISGFIGLVKNKSGTYSARVNINGKPITKGSFDTAEEAAKARDERVLQLYGRYASLNFNDDIIKFIDLVMHQAESKHKPEPIDVSQWEDKPFDINSLMK